MKWRAVPGRSEAAWQVVLLTGVASLLGTHKSTARLPSPPTSADSTPPPPSA